MKTFKQFLLEEMTQQEVIDMINEKCQYFLHECAGTALFRGNTRGEPFEIYRVRKDRKPTLSINSSHKAMDAWQAKHLGVRGRSAGMFATSSERMSTIFGKPAFCFPIGEFKYVWAKQTQAAVDLGIGISINVGEAFKDTLPISRAVEGAIKGLKGEDRRASIDKVMSAVKWHTNNFAEALERGAELSILCDEAILVKTQTALSDGLLKALDLQEVS